MFRRIGKTENPWQKRTIGDDLGMKTKTKKKTKVLNVPASKNKKHSSKGNSVSEFRKNSGDVLSNKEIDKLLGSK